LLHIALELAELHGVGNWAVEAQFAVEGGAAEGDWHYESGLRDSTELAVWSALLEAFAEQTTTLPSGKTDDGTDRVEAAAFSR
jgi:hypothetical protein